MIENYAAGEKNVLIRKIQQMDEVKQTRRGVQHAPITVEGEEAEEREEVVGCLTQRASSSP